MLPHTAAVALRHLSGSSRSSIQRVRESRPAQLLKRRVFEMPAGMVPELLSTLEGAGVRVWVIGGWGVDALLGRQTRRHLDLDLAFEAHDGAEERAIDALAARGFEVVKRETLATAANVPFRLAARLVLADRRRHLVDLHPVSVSAESPPGAGIAVEGEIAGARVRCLDAPAQLALHQGYAWRDFDRLDVELLRSFAGEAEQG